MHRCFLPLLLLLAGTLSALAVAPAQKRVLPNGLTVLVREDRSAPVVSAQAWVRAGSITEADWMGAGLSHVLEHMLFKGTTKRGVAQIAQEIEAHGGYINAYTSFEQTVYYIDLPAAHWRVALDILADCMMNATIPADELEKEKQVIHREMAMNQDNPDRRASLLLFHTAYTTHPYRHPIIGYRDIYDRTTRDDVVAYYRRHYVPNNLMFVVVGDVNADEVFREVETLTKDFTMGPLPPVYIPPEPPQLGPRRRDQDMAVQLTQAHLAWPVPPLTHPDVYALDVLAIILGDGRSSRLYREIVQNRGLAHTVNAWCWTPRDPGLFAVSATVDPDRRDAALAAIQTELQKHDYTDEEVAKAVKITLSNHLAELKTMRGQAADIGQNEFLTGDPNYSEIYLRNLQRVTAADVRRVARQYLVADRLTITTLNPTGRATATATNTATAVASDIQKIQLPNGLRLLVREDPKLPLVDIRVLLQGGVLAETPDRNGITKLTARSLLKGTTHRTADQIADEIESVGGSMGFFAGNNSFGLHVSTLASELDRALDVLADVLQHPTFPADLVERERAVQLAEIKAEQDKILPAAQQLLREALFATHPYRLNSSGTLDAVAALTGDQLREFHRQSVVPNNMVICVFGDVKAADVRARIEALFGSLAARPLEWKRAAERLAAPVRKTETRPKEQAVLLVGFSGTDLFSADRFALDLLNEAYSGQGSRLFLRIRDELGLAYYVGAYQLLGLDPGYFALYVGTTAENVATCEKELFAELARLQTTGLTPEELDRAKNSLIGQQLVRLQDNGELALMAGLDELYGLGFDHYRQLDQRYRAVTNDDIKRIAATYFTDKPAAVVVIQPEGK